jgi:hypothetical protein
VCRPAHNGEALTGCLDQGPGKRRRAMPWEALCRGENRYGPVTTDPLGERLRSCQREWQIYGRGNTRALGGKPRDEGIVCPTGNSGIR